MLRALFQLADLLAAQDNRGRTVLTYAVTSERHVMEAVLTVMATTLSAEKVILHAIHTHLYLASRLPLTEPICFN